MCSPVEKTAEITTAALLPYISINLRHTVLEKVTVSQM